MITKSLADSLMGAEFDLKGTQKALEMAERSTLPVEPRQSMKAYIESKRTTLKALKDKLLKKIPDGVNFIQISSVWCGITASWYGIRVKNGDAVEDIEIHPIIKDLFLLERDGRKVKDLSSRELSIILEECVDRKAHAEYASNLHYASLSCMQSYFGRPWDPSLEVPASGCQEEYPSVPGGKGKFSHLRVSAHAGARFVQRKMGLYQDSQSTAMSYYQEHSVEVNQSILKALDKAMSLWADEDGVSYMFDDDNMVYVLGVTPSPTVVTVYEEDFGWGKDRNRYLVLEQIKDLKKIKKNIAKLEQRYEASSQGNLKRRGEIDAEISVLSAQIDLLKSSYDKLLAEDEESGRELALERKRLIKECGKLFSDRESKRLRVE